MAAYLDCGVSYGATGSVQWFDVTIVLDIVLQRVVFIFYLINAHKLQTFDVTTTAVMNSVGCCVPTFVLSCT